MKKLILTNTKNEVLVDDEDYGWLSKKTWTQMQTGYAARYSEYEGRRVAILMHRAIMRCRPGDKVIIDHINGNMSDNRKSNLRKTNQSINILNTSRCNVWLRKDTNKWTGQISKHTIGCFNTREAAEEAYWKLKNELLAM